MLSRNLSQITAHKSVAKTWLQYLATIEKYSGVIREYSDGNALQNLRNLLLLLLYCIKSPLQDHKKTSLLLVK